MFVKNHDPLARLGFGLTVAATCWIVYNLHRRGSAKALPSEFRAPRTTWNFTAVNWSDSATGDGIGVGTWARSRPGMAILIVGGILNSSAGAALVRRG